jgi:hypothetical protein
MTDDVKALSVAEERLLRSQLEAARSGFTPPVATRTIRRLLKSLDDARAELLRVTGTRVLKFPKPTPPPITAEGPDTAA